MRTTETSPVLNTLFSELVDGAGPAGAFILNSGDIGLLRSLEHRWLQALSSPRDATEVELSVMLGSIAHLAYHLGAIRQINKAARGPKEGTF